MKLLGNFGSTSQYPLKDGTNDVGSGEAIKTTMTEYRRKKEVKSYRKYKERKVILQGKTAKQIKKAIKSPLLPRVMSDAIKRNKRMSGESTQEN
jgi:hypothetical protein